MKQRGILAAREFFPKIEGAKRPPGVEIVAAVSHANHSRLASRACPAISSAVSIEQDDFEALLLQSVSDPRAKYACSYYGYIEWLHSLSGNMGVL
jgi:hypothetical protein